MSWFRKWVRLAPNWRNLGLFKNRFRCIAKMCWNMILKSTKFLQFGADLTNFGSKSEIPELKPTKKTHPESPATLCFSPQHNCQIGRDQWLSFTCTLVFPRRGTGSWIWVWLVTKPHHWLAVRVSLATIDMQKLFICVASWWNQTQKTFTQKWGEEIF